MSDITTSSTYSVGNKSYSNNGLSSLVSGMDTDSMVKKLLSGTQSKIDKQQQAKQVLEWKQDIYRDVITSINKFQSTYFSSSFDSSLKTNLMSSDFFNSMVSKVTSGSDSVQITGTSSDASAANMTVAVNKLASAAKITGTSKLSKNWVQGTIPSDATTLNSTFTPRTVAFNITGSNGGNVVVDLSGVSSTTDMVNKLNQGLNNKGVSVQLSTSGTLSFITNDKNVAVSVDNTKSTTSGLATIGLNGTATSTVSDNTLDAQILYGSSAPDVTAGNTFTITLNGVSKQISIDPVATGSDGKVTQDDVKKALANSLATAYGGTVDSSNNNVTGGYINLTFGTTPGVDGSFHLTTTDASSQFTVTGMQASNIGITPGASSRVSTASTLSELTDGTAGNDFKFEINGHKFSFTGSDTLYTVIDTVNSSSAGVKMSYSALSDTFQMEATSTGANYNISIKQTAGNLLTKLFGQTAVGVDTVPAGSSAGSNALTTKSITGNPDMLSGTMSSASFNLNVNGKDYNLTIPAKSDKTSYSVSSIISSINDILKTQFGSNSTTGVANISIDSTTGNLLVNDGSTVKFAQSTVAANKSDKVQSAQDTDLAYRLGFTISGKNNIATADTKVSELSDDAKNALEGVTGITGNSTLASAASTLGLTFDSDTNTFVGTKDALTNLETNYNDVYKKLFGTKDSTGNYTVNLNKNLLSASDTEVSTVGGGIGSAGSDAIAVVNGTTITRSSNSFTIDGVSMELTKETAGTPAVISTSRDADSIVKTVKQFVDDYNTMVKALRDQTDSDATYRDYAPLTDDQKSQMKDTEITEWEKKAKTGLLRNDDDIMSFLNDMRSAMYTKPTDSNYALYDIGIETDEYTSGSSSLGTLTFDETTFRKALSDDPQSVANLFTDKESGIATQLNSICDATAKISLASPGSLVQLAGVTSKSWSTKNNDIYNQIKDINDKITDLKAKYEDERTRYWKQFNTMETTLSSFNSQSSWLSSQFSTQ